MTRRPLRAVLPGAVAVLVLLTGGCTSGHEATPQRPAEPSSEPPAPAAPRTGSCHALTLDQASAPVDSRPPVPCAKPHTTVTYRSGTLDLVEDGHLLAVDSREAGERLAHACTPHLGRYLGGSVGTLRLSQFQAVWFAPSVEQADAGAAWFRCDVVAVRSEGRLLPLPPSVKGALGRPKALDRYGTCGTGAPGTRKFRRVVCSMPHGWRAVDDIGIDRGAAYLGKAAGAAGDAACRARAKVLSKGALRFSWSFEWPTRQQWEDGRRYGLCWVPD